MKLDEIARVVVYVIIPPESAPASTDIMELSANSRQFWVKHHHSLAIIFLLVVCMCFSISEVKEEY